MDQRRRQEEEEHNVMFAKIKSKGVTEACVTEAKDETEMQKQEQHNIKFAKIELEALAWLKAGGIRLERTEEGVVTAKYIGEISKKIKAEKEELELNNASLFG